MFTGSLLDRNRLKRNCVFIVSLILICFASQFNYGQNLQNERFLEINKPVESELISRADTPDYQIKLTSNQYAKVVIEQTEVDVIAKLFGADGNPLIDYDNEIRIKENETVEIVADREGIYQLKVQSTSKSVLGKYKVRLVELRAANEQDRALFESRTLVKKANELIVQGNYNEGLSLVDRALATAEEKLGKENIYVARILESLGSMQIGKGSYQGVLPLLERANSINEKTLGAEHPQTIGSYKLIADFYQKTREYAKAEKIYREVIENYERTLGKENKILADALSGIGLLMVDLEDTAEAEKLALRAKFIAEKHLDEISPTMRSIINELGIIYLVEKDYDKSKLYFEKALEISEKLEETKSGKYYSSLLNLAVIHVNQKQYEKALELDERALIVGENLFGKESPNVGILLNNIANIYKATGNYEKALEIQLRAFQLGEKSVGPSHRLMMLVIANIAKIYAAQGDVKNAVAYQKLWDERFEKAVSLEMVIGSERQKLAYADTFPPRTSRTITLHLTLAKNNQEALDAGALVVLQRKGRVLDALAESFTALRRRATDEDKELLDRFNKITAQVSTLTLNKPAKISLDEYRKQLADLEEQKEKIEREISNRSAEFSVQLPSVTLDAIKAEIPTNAALVEFAIYRPYDSKAENNNEAYSAPRYVAYILKKNTEAKCVELGDKETIDNTIDKLRKALRDPNRSDVKELARAVDEKLMMPLRPLLSEANHLLISPDGELNLIPFQALIDEKGKYLVENYSFDYLTSGRDLLRMKAPRESKNNSLVIADPLFNNSANNVAVSRKSGGDNRRSVTAADDLSDTYFAPLPGTLLEARSIQSLFPDATSLIGADATESALKRVTSPRILHIATHGFFLRDNEIAGDSETTTRNSKENEDKNPLLRSGLALAGANRQSTNVGDDGILTALETAGLNLWGTKLVVLSACDTGLGEVKNGEGVYGLRRAFVLAGTESLVMSLWAVSDNITRELMTNYYKNLRKGGGRGASLREVQLDMLKNPDRRHPFYWASFIQSGEWANLDGIR